MNFSSWDLKKVSKMQASVIENGTTFLFVIFLCYDITAFQLSFI